MEGIQGILEFLGSAAVKHYAERQALKRQSQLAAQMRQRQMAMQDQAGQVAANKAAEFDPMARQRAQAEIAAQMGQDYERTIQAPQVTAQGTQIGATLPANAGSPEYLATQAKEAAKSTASLRALAALMGRVGSAGELRRNEGVGMADAAGQVGRIQTNAGNMGQLDAARVNNVQVNPGLMFASDALRAFGTADMARAGMKKPAPTWP